jgi:lactoylglutathione lyase
MTSWLEQCRLHVTDLDASLGFFRALGLDGTRADAALDAGAGTDAPVAIVENPAGGSRLELASSPGAPGPFDRGSAFWKLYVNTRDVEGTFAAAVAAGATVEAAPARLERWPVVIAFVRDRDGYLVELVERDPWPDDAPAGAWLGQCCINVTDLERTVAFYEVLGLTCTSRTEIPHAREAILEHPGRGSKLQLAQQTEPEGPLRIGGLGVLTVGTDDGAARLARAADAGYAARFGPTARAGVTVAGLADPDGYPVELVQPR